VSGGLPSPLRIVAHNAASILGGGEIGTAKLLAGLQARGHDVLMLCRDPRIAERVGAYGIPAGVQALRGDGMLGDALALAVRLRRERADVALLTTFRRVLLAGLGARLARTPFVVQRVVLEGDTPARGVRYRLALRRWVHAVVLNAAAMRPAFLAGDPRLDPGRVRTIPDGVRAPTRTRERGALRRELGIPAGAVVVGSVARLARQKRFDRLLHAVAPLGPGVHVLLAGEGEEAGAIRALAAELGLSGRVHLPGFRDDVGDVLDAMDVFAISSDREGMANAMLEAMMAGVPVVSTDVSGAREVLEGGAGVVVERAVGPLAAALRALVHETDRRARLAAAGCARAEARFGELRFLDAWEALLHEGARRPR
jgi:glycosyltransferase involved in cell wall biosynthesis